MTTLAIIKFQVVLGAVALAQGALYRRVPAAAAFRPGVALHRASPASPRAPYPLYRVAPQYYHRYAVQRARPAAAAAAAAAAARAPPLPAHFGLLRAAPAGAQIDAGAIHTIPAPNLSLAEKPIVVVEAGHSPPAPEPEPGGGAPAVRARPSYEVTERYAEPVYQMAKIEMPIGFSKMQFIEPAPALQPHLRAGPAPAARHAPGVAPTSPARLIPHTQQYSLQGFHGFSAVPLQQDPPSTGADSAPLPPSVLYQPDQLFLQKLQQQLLHRFPALEFVPYAAELVSHDLPNEAPPPQQLFLLENEEMKRPPEPFLSSESKNLVQREAQRSSSATLSPQAFVVSNMSEEVAPTATEPAPSTAVEAEPAESHPATSTTCTRYAAESSTAPPAGRAAHASTPIYYAQVGRSVGSLVADGVYSAANDARAAAALERVAPDGPAQTTRALDSVSTASPIRADLEQYFVQNKISGNASVTEMKPLLGVPFAKPADAVEVAYTLLRMDAQQPKNTREGAVYAGQIVEASISEDQEFNNQKATLMKRAPIRLHVADGAAPAQPSLAGSTPKVTLVKGKMPPKSKLAFDDKTGEPVLRIYASYVDTPPQRQAVPSQPAALTSLKAGRHEAAGDVTSWKATTDKSQGFDGNQLTRFGLKLRARSDDYAPLFQEYDE